MATRAHRRRVAPPQADAEPVPPHAMRATWRDPDDVTPGARRTPREITGFRTSCPLRRMLVHANSGITQEYILAADKLREQVDIATLGFTAARPLIYIAQFHLPRAGMGPAALAQMRAIRSVRRAMALFDTAELMTLEAIVLRNLAIAAWLKTVPLPSNPLLVKRSLLAILDKLAQHFAAEVEDDIARGRRLSM